MDSKRDILLYLLDNNILAPSKSYLSKQLGRSDKHLINDRLVKAKESDKAFVRLWDKLCFLFGISEYTLFRLPDIWEWSSRLVEQQKLSDFKDLYEHNWSCIKDRDLAEQLMDLYKDSIVDYNYVVGLFYTKMQAKEQSNLRRLDPNAKKDSSVLIEMLQQIDAILYQQYPEATAAHKVALDYIAQDKEYKMVGWCHLMVGVGRVISYYTHPMFLDQSISNDYQEMPFGEITTWTEENPNTEATKIWYVKQINGKGGVYNVMEINAQRDLKINENDCSFQRWAFTPQYDLVRCIEPQGDKVIRSSYFNYKYEPLEDGDKLHLQVNEEFLGKNPIDLPRVLKRIYVNDKWANWVEAQSSELNQILYDLAVQGIGFEQTSYKVSDIVLSRKTCTIIIKSDRNEVYRVSFDIEKYQYLKEISIWDEAFIFRGKLDGAMYAYWDSPRISIKLPDDWQATNSLLDD